MDELTHDFSPHQRVKLSPVSMSDASSRTSFLSAPVFFFFFQKTISLVLPLGHCFSRKNSSQIEELVYCFANALEFEDYINWVNLHIPAYRDFIELHFKSKNLYQLPSISISFGHEEMF